MIFTEAVRTEVATTVGTIFTDKALALDISDLVTDQAGIMGVAVTIERGHYPPERFADVRARSLQSR